MNRKYVGHTIPNVQTLGDTVLRADKKNGQEFPMRHMR